MPAQQTNRLAHETSPYLLQHAHNPVDWYPWGDEALARARDENRLILLSIGYSACHWCHVMERESFENDAIAAVMNEHYVNIKVDREERPDLDDVYMAATVAMNHGQGGWPMTVFLTPDLEPVFAGTYFPPDDLPGRPGFPRVLTEIARAWREDRDRVRETAARFVEQLRAQRGLGRALPVGVAELRLAAEQYGQDFDEEDGGFGPAPKFPPAVGLMLLLRLHRRFGDPAILHMARRTLDAMAAGGMYDHVGGGFARYSTDAQWLVPHFEKMLYDNALLVRAYLEAYQVAGQDDYRRVAVETLDYVLREMTAPEGSFFSSTDADSEGEEGKFFVWQASEIEQALGSDDARLFNAYYGVSEAGNWEGTNILHTPRPLADVAARFDLTADEAGTRLADMRRRLYAVRQERVRPGLDDKILTAWNGLMISAFAEGHRILGDPRYLEAARRAADCVLETLVTPDGNLLRTYRAGKAHVAAYLEDYAQLGEGLVDLYETSGDARYLLEAERLAERVLSAFADAEGGAFFNTAADHEALIVRYRDGADGATPSPNAVTAALLARLSFHLDREDLRTAAIGAIKAYGGAMARYPRAFAKSLIVVDFLLERPVELALAGRPGDADLEALARAIGRPFLPNRIQALVDPSVPEAGRLPLAAGKTPVNGEAALYVCRDFTCAAPVTDASRVADALAGRAAPGEPTTIGRRLGGSASPEGTRRYADRFPGSRFVPMGATGIVASALGFGGYRVDDVTPSHEEALVRAVMTGVNVLDTSTNYGDGASERLVGSVLNRLAAEGDVQRDEVVVVSKIGYVQGAALAVAKRREAAGTPFPDMVKLGDDLWHCVHPDYLAEQLDASLARLEVGTLDVCLLHNPEYFLSWSASTGQSREDARAELRGRLRSAFAFFERQVDAGTIRWYGVSSNTVAREAGTPDRTYLSDMLSAAEEAGGPDHHFRVLQLPLNLLETGAIATPADGNGDRTVLDVARAAGVGVLANRPLNAFTSKGLVRLADIDVVAGPDVEESLAALGELEEGFRREIAPTIAVPSEAMRPEDYFRWSGELERLASAPLDVEQWSRVEGQIRHSVNHIVSALDRNLGGDVAARWAAWRERYLGGLARVLQAFRARVSERARDVGTSLRGRLEPVLPEGRRGEALASLALWVVSSTPGVTCVLNGMRAPEYVRTANAVLSWDPLPDVAPVYGALASYEGDV